MHRLGLALAAALIFLGSLLPGPALAACGSANPNCIVPTAPFGTSDNRAASTQFVQQGLASLALPSGKIYIGSVANVATPQTLSGDGSLSIAGVFALLSVNANVGSFGSGTQCPAFTVNAKGLITAASQTICAPAIGSITGLGSGMATWLGTPSSANLAAAVTDETGTGALVFGTAPTIAGAATFPGVPIFSGLSPGTCSSGLAIDGSNSLVKATCPGGALNGNNLIKNAGLGVTTGISTVLVNSPSARVNVTGFAQQGGAGSGNVRFTTSGGNAGLKPGKLVTILGANTASLSFTATVTGGNTITATTSVFSQAQGDLIWITGGTNSSARTQFRVVSATSTVLVVGGGLVNEASKTFVATAQQGGYPSAVDATVNGIPQAGNVFSPAFFYYTLQVTSVGTNFFDAQLAGMNLNVGASSAASAYEVTNGSQNTGCIGPDWWSCTSTISYYKMRQYDWDGSTIINMPGSLYSGKLVKGAATEEFFWQDLSAVSPATVNIQNYAGLANLLGKGITCGAYLWAPNASQGRIFLYDGVTRTYSGYVTPGSFQWVEVSATISASASTAQSGVSLGAGSVGDSFLFTQPICKSGIGVIGSANYAPASPAFHMFISHTNPFYYINQAVPAAVAINIEQETNGALPTGMEAVQADIGGYNTNALSLIMLADTPGSPQMSACVSPNPATTTQQGNQTCMVGISKKGSGDGQFVIDYQWISVNGNSHWQNVTVDYLGGLY